MEASFSASIDHVAHGLRTLAVCLVIRKLALTSAEIIDHVVDDDDDDTPQDSGAREEGL